MIKKLNTKSKILESGMDYVCQFGLVNISIGEIAKRTNMSRTGVISHFANKADMQIAILRHCENIYITHVIKPSLHLDPIINLKQFLHNWMNWVYKFKHQKSMSCPFVKAVAEYQDRPQCSVKQVIREQQERSLKYLESLAQRCVDSGVFVEHTQTGVLVSEIYGYYLAHNVTKYLLESRNADEVFIEQTNNLLKSVTNNQV